MPAGDEIDYLVTLANHGPDVAPDAKLTVHLPDGIVNANGALQHDRGQFTANDDGQVSPPTTSGHNTVTCDLQADREHRPVRSRGRSARGR